MERNFKLYNGLEFIKKTEKGEIDIERSKNIVRELAIAAQANSIEDIILDLRETETVLNFGDLLIVASEFAEYPQAVDGKIAVIMPREDHRIQNVKFLKNSMMIKGLTMEYFFEYEDAIDWL